MKYLPTPDFAAKLREFAQAPEVLGALSVVLSKLELLQPSDFDAARLPKAIVALTDGMFVAHENGLILFFTLQEDQNDESILLLLDIAHIARGASTSLTRARDPRRNAKYSPQRNSAINPLRNSAVNPLRNSAINPLRNSAINPLRNSAINPLRNSAINPLRNSAINPLRNSAINPKRNRSLNPRVNHAYDGPFVYDRDLTEIGFIVRANDCVNLIFDMNAEFVGLGVRNSVDGFTLFDRKNKWVGQLVPTVTEAFLRYNESNEWTGLVV
jgi:hypothetical protein